jgi:hypothetical protein
MDAPLMQVIYLASDSAVRGKVLVGPDLAAGCAYCSIIQVRRQAVGTAKIA